MDTTTLLADIVTGNKRTGVLKTDDEDLSVRARKFEDEDRTILQIRGWLEPLGHYLHVYIDAATGAVLVTSTGTQDVDAFDRAVQELKRRGIDLKS